MPFVGRSEGATLAHALDAGEAITLVGTGGVENRVWQSRRPNDGSGVPGAPQSSSHSLESRRQVADAVARALEVRDEQGLAVLDAIAGALVAEPRALLLDNCEDAGAAVAAVIERLQGIEGVPILATSRSRLVTEGERILHVRPFDSREGGAFFAARARNAAVRVDVDGADAPAVNRIVTSLDGLAIAIDLAAARLASLTVLELADELTNPRPYHFRSTGSSEPRHWTLNHVVDWSVAKLDERTQTMFALASRFAGSFTESDVAALAGVLESTSSVRSNGRTAIADRRQRRARRLRNAGADSRGVRSQAHAIAGPAGRRRTFRAAHERSRDRTARVR